MEVSRNLKRRFCIYAILVLLCANYSAATTLVFLVTHSSIIVGADSKVMAPKGNRIRRTSPSGINKAVIVRDLFVVAAGNLSSEDIFTKDHVSKVFSYDFAKWIVKVQEKLPKNLSIPVLTHVIESESGITFKNFDKYIAGGALSGNYAPDPLIEYFIVGYESGIPTINDVYFRIDRNKNHLEGPTVDPVYPNNKAGLSYNLHVACTRDVIVDLNAGKRETSEELGAMIPKELPKLLSRQDLSLSEGINVCLAILRYEARHHKDFVAPPYTITVVPPLGMGGITQATYSN
jgi:hypothetical protein